MSENPQGARGVLRDDVLSSLLGSIRLSGSLQFCLMPGGEWQTDATPRMARLAGRSSGTIPFHIVAHGECWLMIDGARHPLRYGDVVMFPFGTGHALGVGSAGRLIAPTMDLPPKPWRDIPMLRYGGGPYGARLLCGYLQCDTLSFAPLRQSLPRLIHVETESADRSWLSSTIKQMVEEVDRPRPGGVSMLPRLTEIVFIEILRHQIMMAAPARGGWLAALRDPVLARCLSLIHDQPTRDWALDELAAASAISRSALAERFQDVLGTSPIRYLRDWRLHLASLALATTGQPISAIAHEAGYATEASFNRAFSRAFGAPPAAWRSSARHDNNR